MINKKALLLCPMKTATTTITMVLVEHNVSFVSLQQSRAISHSLPLRFVQELGDDIFTQTFVILFVRNPYDRVVSYYEFQNKRNRKFDLPEIPDFETFIKNDFVNTPDHTLMSHYLTYQDRPIVNFVGRFENLIDDIHQILHILAVKDIQAIPHLQKREVDYIPYQEYYTTELQDIVYETMCQDFQIFNYPHKL